MERAPAEAGPTSKSDPHVVIWPPNAEDEGNWPGRPQGLPPAFGFYVYFPSLYVAESIKNSSFYFSMRQGNKPDLLFLLCIQILIPMT